MVVGPCGRGLVRAALSRPATGASEDPGAGTGGAPAPSLINVANALTVARLCLVPVFVVLLLTGGDAARIAACVTFGVASATDFLDGELARRRGLITDFGKIADPIADKALTGSALVVLSYLGELPWWVTGVILFRELAVTGLRFWVISRGVIAASRGGKAKTLLQVIAIALYILPGPFDIARQLVMAAALVVTVATGVDYVARAARLRRAAAHGGSGAGEARGAGGLLAAALPSVPGASAVFRGGVVAYATDLKAALLGVPSGLLERDGAVHPS